MSSQKETIARLFERLEAVEVWLGGTPEKPGLSSRLDALRADVDHKFAQLNKDVDHRFDSILYSLKINNWLTGLIVTILIAYALRGLFGVMS